MLLDLAPVVLDAPADPLAAAEALVAVLDDRGVTPADGTNLGADPIGRVRAWLDRLDHRGGSTTESTLVAVAELARAAGTLGVVVDATAVHDLGASDAQELGYSLAVGAAYLRTLTEAGIPLDEARRPDRVPVRRHRRAVPHHRQAPRGPPALGPRPRAERGQPSRAASASTR